MTTDLSTDPLLAWKSPFLNEPFFYIRCGFYLLFFSLAGLLYRNLSMRQDEDGDPRITLRLRHTAYGFIPLFVLCLTFAGFDWLMSLDHHWYSTMWGFIFCRMRAILDGHSDSYYKWLGPHWTPQRPIYRRT